MFLSWIWSKIPIYPYCEMQPPFTIYELSLRYDQDPFPLHNSYSNFLVFLDILCQNLLWKCTKTASSWKSKYQCLFGKRQGITSYMVAEYRYARISKSSWRERWFNWKRIVWGMLKEQGEGFFRPLIPELSFWKHLQDRCNMSLHMNLPWTSKYSANVLSGWQLFKKL